LKPVLRIVELVAGLAVVLVLCLLIFQIPLSGSLNLLWQGAFGDKFALSRTAVKATPMLLTGLGMVVAWRGGMYNIGGEGQFVMGGLTGAAFAKLFVIPPHQAPSLIAQVLILLCCVAGGAGWAWLAGWLYVKRCVEVVLSTILLTFVALQCLD